VDRPEVTRHAVLVGAAVVMWAANAVAVLIIFL
jgi:hypothetical protein